MPMLMRRRWSADRIVINGRKDDVVDYRIYDGERSSFSQSKEVHVIRINSFMCCSVSRD